MNSRELYSVGDRPEHFYMIGSMGLASSIGLGVALRRPERPVVILDGDGNVLMNLGTLGNIGESAPANLFHLVIDNGVHASTGGQRTISREIPLEEIARSCGYLRSERVGDLASLERSLRSLWREPGPAFLLIEVEPGNVSGIGRVEMDPPEIARRFRECATGTKS
jgi:thiamine pyrophosphate-dependent acetolactate synthase large subunit-like protein